MNTEDSEFARLEHEALLRAAQLVQPEQEPVAWQLWVGADTPLNAPMGWQFYSTYDSKKSAEVSARTINGYQQAPFAKLVPLYTTPPPCPTCEALARTVMLDQTSHDNQRIAELEAMLERQTARIVDLQTHIDNFDGEDR